MKTISKHTVVSRINDRLGQRVRVATGEPAGGCLWLELTPDSYTIVDSSGAEVFCGDDLEALALEVGVLRPGERVAR
jgi:hypothetical protein